MRSILPPTYGLAALRAGFGLYFLTSAYDAARQGWLSTGFRLDGLLQQALPRAVPGYDLFLRALVIPHADVFARLITLSEFAVGLSLLLGILTTIGASLGIWLSLNYLLLAGAANLGASLAFLFVLGELVVLLTAAGLVWGLDGVVWRRTSPQVLNRGYSTAALPYSASLAIRLRARAQVRGHAGANSKSDR